jgi:exoribonuclease-2
LFSIISAFESAYTAYNGYQASMERFWTLQYLQQNSITQLPATVIKVMPGQPVMARADTLPLVLPITNPGDIERGTHVLLQVGNIDLISLDVHAQLLQILQDNTAQTDVSEEAEDDTPAGPLTIAVDLNDTSEENAA